MMNAIIHAVAHDGLIRLGIPVSAAADSMSRQPKLEVFPYPKKQQIRRIFVSQHCTPDQKHLVVT